MNIYLIKDYCRIDGVTGLFTEEEFSGDFARYDSAISLKSARNQYVSFQVVFDARDTGRLEKMEIEFTDLKAENSLLKADYEVFIEWFHKVEGKYIPDLLLPLGKTNLDFKIPLHEGYLKEQKVGALWVDLFIPEEAKSGSYSGVINIKADGSQWEFKIEVMVYDVMVPYESRIIADFNNYADNISPAFPHLANNPDRYRDGSFFEVESDFIRMAREHRTLFDHLAYQHSGAPVESFAPELEGSGKYIRVKSWELFDRHFGPYLDGSVFKGSRRGEYPLEFLFMPFNIGWPANYEKWGKKGFRTEYRRILAEFARHFEEKGWTETNCVIMLNNKKEYRFYPTTQDEIWYRHDEEIVDQYFDIVNGILEHSHAKFVYRSDSSNHYGNHYDSKYSDLFGMWVAAMGMLSWFPESIQVMKNKGNILWEYGWWGHGMTIDSNFTSFLTHPMFCFMTGCTGFCSFWNICGFGDDYLNTPLVNGGQAIMYPGTEFGYKHVLPSVRLKVMRNLMQLADLMMTTDGLEQECSPAMRAELERIVNKHYGYKSNDEWWCEKPPFINEEPRYWDFGEAMKPYTKNHHEGKSPAIIERIAHEVYEELTY